jgi:GTP-binding protein
VQVTSCRFERSAFRPEDEPPASGPGAVFLGRSNVGKSSLINKLVGVKRLARTSSQPGRTQSINFYRINECCDFVDLPGYGYAKVPLAVRRTWEPMVEGFLMRRRERIALALLVLDARRRPTEMDMLMRDWLVAGRIPHLAVATKADKLSGNGKARARKQLQEAFDSPDGLGPLLVSAHTGLGMREVWRQIDSAFAEAKARRGGR